MFTGCQMREKKNNLIPKIGVISVVLKDNSVLLVQRKNNPDADLWSYPGGHLKFGEKIFDACERETLEETGIIVRSKEFLTNLDIFIENENGEIYLHYLLVAVLCNFIKGEICPSDDAKDAKWYDVNYILREKLPMSKNVSNVLRFTLKKTELSNRG